MRAAAQEEIGEGSGEGLRAGRGTAPPLPAGGSPRPVPGRVVMQAMKDGSMFEIREDDLSGDATARLLALHLAGMHADSPPGTVYALDRSGLQAPGVTFWSVWEGDQVVGIGALRALSDDSGEVKSMRTHPDHLRRGVAALLLDHIVAAARARGMTRLSLETGTGPAFEPALALYRRRGFVAGPAFSDYRASAFNQFLHLQLPHRD